MNSIASKAARAPVDVRLNGINEWMEITVAITKLNGLGLVAINLNPPKARLEKLKNFELFSLHRQN